jgi:large subunit GTPase 1
MAPTEVEDVFNTHKIANTNTLLKELKKLALSIKGDRERVIEETKEQPNYNYKNVCIGMVGYPNVGKSSVINTLCNRKLVGVAPRPGKTKHFQTIQLQEDIMVHNTKHPQLCDCPGLVFPNAASSRAEMVCNGILPIDNMKDHLSPMDVLASRIPKVPIPPPNA